VHCEEEQEQGANAVNSDDYYPGGDDGDGGCGGDGDGDGDGDGGGGRAQVDYKVEELGLGNEHCLSCSANAEGRMTDLSA
jgi:hypothetical protein